MTAPDLELVTTPGGTRVGVYPLSGPLAGGVLPGSAIVGADGSTINAATAEGQASALTALQAIVTALGGVLDIGGTVAVSNLPADPPTATNQATGNAALACYVAQVAVTSAAAAP